MATISVIIPTYNSQATLAGCIESVISQEGCDYEICVVDGNSSDDTIKIVQEYSRRFGFIKFISEKDNGPYDAMNKGIDMSSGEWLYFLGSSDLIYSRNTFQEVFAAPVPGKVGLLYGNVLVSDDTAWAKAGQIYNGEFNIEKLLLKNICHQAIFYRRSVFGKLGKYNLRYPICADWEMNMRFFLSTKVHFLDLIVAHFSGGGLSATMGIYDPIFEDLPFLRKKYFRNYLLMRKISRKIKSVFFN